MAGLSSCGEKFGLQPRIPTCRAITHSNEVIWRDGRSEQLVEAAPTSSRVYRKTSSTVDRRTIITGGLPLNHLISFSERRCGNNDIAN